MSKLASSNFSPTDNVCLPQETSWSLEQPVAKLTTRESSLILLEGPEPSIG